MRTIVSSIVGALLGTAVVAGVPPHSATAPETESHLVEIRVAAPAFERFCERLKLDDGQRALAVARLEVYRNGVSELDSRLQQRLYVELGVDDDSSAVDFLRDLPAAEAGRMVAFIHDLSKGARAESDLLRSALLMDVAALLHPSQLALWDRALRALRRDLLLNPGIDRRGPNRRIDLGVSVDLNEVLEEARESGGELAALAEGHLLSEQWETIDDSIRGLMAEHNRVLDGMLAGRATALLDGKQEMRRAVMEGDLTRVKRIHKTLVRRRRAVKHLNYRTARRISHVLRDTIGDDLSDRWMVRVDRAHFPETFRIESPDHMYDWLSSQPQIDDEVKEVVSIVYLNFARSREILRQKAKALVMTLNEDRPAYFRHEPHPADDSLAKKLFHNSRNRLSLLAQMRQAANS